MTYVLEFSIEIVQILSTAYYRTKKPSTDNFLELLRKEWMFVNLGNFNFFSETDPFS